MSCEKTSPMRSAEKRLQLGRRVGVRAQRIGSARFAFGRVIGADGGERAKDLGDRPVGDAVAVGQAAALDDGPALFGEPGRRLTRQPALAHAGYAEDRE